LRFAALARSSVPARRTSMPSSPLRDDRFAMPKGGALPAQGITSGELWDIVVKGLLSLDGAAHHRQRRLVSKAFTPKAAGRLRTTCADVIAELVYQHVGAGRCDVVADIARQYPIPIICALLGTPREDWHLFSTWADDIFKVFDWNVVNDAPDIVGAWKELEAYLDEMVTGRRDALTDDLLSDMMRAEVDGDRLGHDELLTLAGTLLMAGTDTTRNQLAAAKLTYRAAVADLNGIQAEIANALDATLRKVRSWRDSIESYETVVRFNEDLLKTERERLKVGTIEPRKVFEVEADLLDSRQNLAQALVQLQRTMLQLQVVAGSLLKDRGLDMNRYELREKTLALLHEHKLSRAEYLPLLNVQPYGDAQ